MSDPYLFGFVDELVDIHFPKKGNNNLTSAPWYWYITQQTPYYFQYLSNAVGGHGWQCAQFLPIIKILPIDTRPLVPTSQVGFGGLEEAIRKTETGSVSQDAWGRFRFDDKGFNGPGSDFFFKVIGKKKPRYRSQQGLLVSQTDAINITMKEAVEAWRDDWNTLADTFNQAFQAVDNGGYTIIPPNSSFSLPTPGPNIPLPQLQRDFGKYYFGAMPATAVFATGQPFFWKSAYCFKMEVAQLDSTVWDMSVFPPKDASLVGSERLASSVSHKYGGYNVTYSDFPQNGLNIN